MKKSNTLTRKPILHHIKRLLTQVGNMDHLDHLRIK